MWWQKTAKNFYSRRKFLFPPTDVTLDENDEDEQKDFFETNFRRALKAKAMNFRQARPLELIREP